MNKEKKLLQRYSWRPDSTMIVIVTLESGKFRKKEKIWGGFVGMMRKTEIRRKALTASEIVQGVVQ